MALRFVAILGTLLVLANIYVNGEGNQGEDTEVQNSFWNDIQNADLSQGLIKSSSLGNAGNRGNSRRKQRRNLKKKKAKAKKKTKRQKKNKASKKSVKRKRGKKGKNGRKSLKKSKKKKTKKNKKNGRKKHKKASRKNGRKSLKKSKKKKAKKSKKTGKKKHKKVSKKNGKNKHKKASRKKVAFKATVCEDCVVKLATYAKLYVAQAKNRKQQILRMEAACKTSKKKVAKKELFDGPYKMLLDNAGGNKSDPRCQGKSIGKAIGSSASSSSSNGDSDSTSISINSSSISINSSSSSSTSRQETSDGDASVADMTTLEACNGTIGSKCNICQLDDPTTAKKAEDCKTAMVEFIKKMDNCLNVTKYGSQKDLCKCVDEIDDKNKTLENQIRGCQWVTQASLTEVENKRACVGAFSACRKAEDAAVGHLHKCKLPLLKCGGVTTVEQAKVDLPILKDLKTELDATELKMKSGFTSNGLAALNTSSDSKTPSGLDDFTKNPSGSVRAITKCRQLAQAYLEFNQSAKGTGETANSNLNGTEAGNTTSLLKQMKERDFNGEILDCKNGTDGALLVIVRFYGATMILWRTKVVDVKIVVLSLVISNAAKEEATTAAEGATTVSAAGGESTAAPAETTAGPAETTAGPAAETTAAPAETTAAPVETTTAAADTTAAVSTAKAQGRKKRFMDTMQWLKQKVLKN